jgi:hypothetical protein
MNLNNVYTSLEVLNQGASWCLDNQAAEHLQGLGLVAYITADEYSNIASSKAQIEFLSGELSLLKSHTPDYESRLEQLNKLREKYELNLESAQRQDAEIRTLGETIQTNNLKIKNIESELDGLNELKEDIEESEYLRTSVGDYVKLTEKSESEIEHMKARLHNFVGRTYEDFSSAMDKRREELGLKAKRLVGIYTKLNETYGEDGENEESILRAAQLLSRFEGEPEELLKKFEESKLALEKEGWKENLPLLLAAPLMRYLDDSAESAAEKLDELYQSIDYTDSVEDRTNLALFMMGNPSVSVEDLCHFCKSYDDSEFDDKFPEGDNFTDIEDVLLIARLGLIDKEDKFERINEIYQEFEEQLEINFDNCGHKFEAHTIMAGSDFTPTVLVQRTNQVYSAMKNLDWGIPDKEFEIPVAQMAVLADNPREMVADLDLAYYALEKNGFEEESTFVKTNLALSLLVDSNVDLWSEQLTYK